MTSGGGGGCTRDSSCPLLLATPLLPCTRRADTPFRCPPPAQISTVNMGLAVGWSCAILAFGKKGMRKSLPHSLGARGAGLAWAGQPTPAVADRSSRR